MSERRTVVIVGASAAGLRCAARLARLRPDWRVTVLEQRQTFSWAACGLPYVLSGDISEADALRRTADGTLRDEAYFAAVKGVEVLSDTRVVGIDTRRRELRAVSAGDERVLAWDELVLATGGGPRRLPGQPEHPRVHCFHSAAEAERLTAGLKDGSIERVCLVGGGFVGCELAEAFTALWGAEVTLLEAAAQPLSMIVDREVGAVVTHALESNDVRVRTDRLVERIEADDEHARVHAGGEPIEADAVVVALGIAPEVELARAAGVELGPTGAIAVDERLATSVPHVWAAGDCVEVRHAVTGEACHLPLGSLANRQGRAVADAIAGVERRAMPVVGAVALKVFDLNVAAAGITRAAALARGIDARSAWVCAHDRAHYWPEAKEICLNLVYEPRERRVLGVQAVGDGEVAKRIDTAAQLIARSGDLHDFAEIEHAYAPPYAPALDPLAVAAFVALDQEQGVEALAPDAALDGGPVLDVRNPDEREARPVTAAGLRAVSQDQLRTAALDGDNWIVVCERGTRSAEAVRYLLGRGVRARFLGGGLRWRALMGMALE